LLVKAAMRLDADRKPTVLASTPAFQVPKRHLGFFENPASLLDKLKSGDGGPGAAIGPLEENGSQPILEFSKTPTQSRLADIDGFRCLSQAPVLRRNNR
jgi:hypothetical protein